METVKQENATIETQKETDTKTFTQVEVDAIVADRLKRERAKYEGYEDFKAKAAKLDEIEEANKTELQKATERAQALEAELDGMKKKETIREIREKVAKDTGVPASLLHGGDEETCNAEAQELLAFASNSGGYPSLRDGGEVTTITKGSARADFAQFAAAMEK